MPAAYRSPCQRLSASLPTAAWTFLPRLHGIDRRASRRCSRPMTSVVPLRSRRPCVCLPRSTQPRCRRCTTQPW
eukprot:7969338-Heterocapsa_arctica.AAC.1